MGCFLLIKNGNIETAIGNRRAFTNQTAIKMFINDAPTKKDSAITNCPGKAYVKKVEKKLCWKLKPIFFNKAPIAKKLQPRAIAGLSTDRTDNKPFK